MSEKYKISINSAMIYIIAFLLTTILHEFFHALVGKILGSSPIIHHNYVEHLATGDLSLIQKASIALAGPFISLLQGIISATLYTRIKTESHGFRQLFLLWFSVLGMFNFLGYVMTGVFFRKGDIGKVYFITNTPLGIQIALAIIAALIFVFVAYKVTSPYLKFSYKKEWVENGKARKNFSFHTLLLPWIIGSITITILYLPVVALISIIYPVMSGMIFIFPWQNADTIKTVRISDKRKLGEFSYLLIGLLILLIVLFKFVLAPGIEF